MFFKCNNSIITFAVFLDYGIQKIQYLFQLKITIHKIIKVINRDAIQIITYITNCP